MYKIIITGLLFSSLIMAQEFSNLTPEEIYPYSDMEVIEITIEEVVEIEKDRHIEMVENMSFSEYVNKQSREFQTFKSNN